jgi:hypothetical protein
MALARRTGLEPNVNVYAIIEDNLRLLRRARADVREKEYRKLAEQLLGAARQLEMEKEKLRLELETTRARLEECRDKLVERDPNAGLVNHWYPHPPPPDAGREAEYRRMRDESWRESMERVGGGTNSDDDS